VAVPPQDLNAVVSQRIEVAPGLIILRIVPDGWGLPDFKPGQFAVVGLPASAPRCAFSDEEDPPPDPAKLVRRSYSIASSSLNRQYIEFYVTLVRSGDLSPRLFALSPGDRVWLGPKITGLFTLSEVPEDKHLALVATGTGLAPYMSMLRTLLEPGGPRRYAVVHGARHSWDLGYRSELITLQRVCPNFAYLPVVSRPDEEPVAWTQATGYVQDLWTSGAVGKAWGLEPSPENTHVFLCGNPDMVDNMVRRLQEQGYREHTRKEPGQIHVERYW
jgi:ferredoxin--NADP+ reductase